MSYREAACPTCGMTTCCGRVPALNQETFNHGLCVAKELAYEEALYDVKRQHEAETTLKQMQYERLTDQNNDLRERLDDARVKSVRMRHFAILVVTCTGLFCGLAPLVLRLWIR